MHTRTIRDIEVAGRTVLVRVDYNVPFQPGTTEISDDGRIKASLATVQHLAKQGCKVVLCSHLGRPGGRIVEELRMAPVARRLSELLDRPVVEVRDCVGPDVQDAVDRLMPGGIMLLENLRFHPDEEENDPHFASRLASLADIYVNDAFGAAHRAHASTEGVARFLPSAAGFLMSRELEMLGLALGSPERPFAAILGGAKVSDKMGVLESLAGRVDTLIIGGGMAATFLKAKGLQTGDSPVEDDRLPFAADFMKAVQTSGPDLLIPVDVVVADSFAATAAHRTVAAPNIPRSWLVMDIGPETSSLCEEALRRCRTIVWNGPMGVFEWEPFAQGTVRVANLLAGLDHTTTVVGGGSTSEVVDNLGLAGKMTHVSTGGGASLELLEGKVLPGVVPLMANGEPSSAAL